MIFHAKADASTPVDESAKPVDGPVSRSGGPTKEDMPTPVDEPATADA
jgi:hypothetical protein